jgi:valyl-tRNA synthetase
VVFDTPTSELMVAFNNIYTFSRELRTKAGIKQASVINVKLITKEKIQIDNLNQLLQHFNVKVQQISSKRINQDAKIATFDNHIIEYENEYLSKEQEVQKLQSELKYFENEVKRSQNILANKSFVAKAPKEKVILEKNKLQKYLEQQQKITSTLKQILQKK